MMQNNVRTWIIELSVFDRSSVFQDFARTKSNKSGRRFDVFFGVLKIFFKFSESIRERCIHGRRLELRRPEIVLVSVRLAKKSSVKGAKSIKELIEPSVYDDLFVVSNDANLFGAEEEMSTRYLSDVV